MFIRKVVSTADSNLHYAHDDRQIMAFSQIFKEKLFEHPCTTPKIFKFCPKNVKYSCLKNLINYVKYLYILHDSFFWFFSIRNGILLPKFFDLLWEKIVLVIEKNLKFEAEGREFAKFSVKGQNNFGNRMLS